jgi:CBS domain containing-hemolysin-like protein
MVELVIFFVFAVVVSFICSLSEAGLLSIRRPDVVKLKESGHWSGKALEKLKKDVDRPLAGILTVNTLANCFGAAGVGSAAAKIWGSSGMATASAVLTLCILVFSEIIPKTLGALHAVRLSGVITVAVRGMLYLTYPIVLVMGQISKLMGSAPQKYTREDVSLAAKIGLDDGVIDRDEAKIVANVLKVANTSVSECMTPRDQVTVFDKNSTVDGVSRDEQLVEHSRFPIYGSGPDDIVGLVRRDEILRKLQLEETDCRLEEIARPVPKVRITQNMRQVAEETDRQKSKLLVVVDDQDRFCGIITEHAVQQLILGEISDG